MQHRAKRKSKIKISVSERARENEAHSSAAASLGDQNRSCKNLDFRSGCATAAAFVLRVGDGRVRASELASERERERESHVHTRDGK